MIDSKSKCFASMFLYLPSLEDFSFCSQKLAKKSPFHILTRDFSNHYDSTRNYTISYRTRLTTYPHSSWCSYRRLDARRFPYHEYHLHDMAFYGIFIRVHWLFCSCYRDPAIPSTQDIWTRYRLSTHLLYRWTAR